MRQHAARNVKTVWLLQDLFSHVVWRGCSTWHVWHHAHKTEKSNNDACCTQQSFLKEVEITQCQEDALRWVMLTPSERVRYRTLCLYFLCILRNVLNLPAQNDGFICSFWRYMLRFVQSSWLWSCLLFFIVIFHGLLVPFFFAIVSLSLHCSIFLLSAHGLVVSGMYESVNFKMSCTG